MYNHTVLYKFLHKLEGDETRPSGCKYPTPPRGCQNITRDHRGRLASSNGACFTHYKHISYFFNKFSFSFVYLLSYFSGISPYGRFVFTATLCYTGEMPLHFLIRKLGHAVNTAREWPYSEIPTHMILNNFTPFHGNG